MIIICFFLSWDSMPFPVGPNLGGEPWWLSDAHLEPWLYKSFSWHSRFHSSSWKFWAFIDEILSFFRTVWRQAYLLATPLETSQFNMPVALTSASQLPSSTKPKPPFITSPLQKQFLQSEVSHTKEMIRHRCSFGCPTFDSRTIDSGHLTPDNWLQDYW